MGIGVICSVPCCVCSQLCYPRLWCLPWWIWILPPLQKITRNQPLMPRLLNVSFEGPQNNSLDANHEGSGKAGNGQPAKHPGVCHMGRVSVLLMVTQSGTTSISETINTGTHTAAQFPWARDPPSCRGVWWGVCSAKTLHKCSFNLGGKYLIIYFCFLENSSVGKRQHLQGRGLSHTPRTDCFASPPLLRQISLLHPSQHEHGTARRQAGSKARFLTHFFPP